MHTERLTGTMRNDTDYMEDCLIHTYNKQFRCFPNQLGNFR